jgi:hypothetical protein
VQGLSTILAFNRVDTYIQNNYRHVDRNSASYFAFYTRYGIAVGGAAVVALAVTWLRRTC